VQSGEQVVALRGIYQDVTDRRAAERLKDEFLATVSHELRTPLSLIVGFTQLLPRGRSEVDDTDTVVVEALARNARELERMVVRLLDYAELQVDRKPVVLESLSAREVIEASLVHARLGSGGHRVVNAVAPDLVVRCDRAAVFRIIDNLVGSAAKYAPAGSTIEVTARSDGEWVIVSVADQGPGLPAELRSRAFERFVQGPSQPTAVRATGIGLAIVTRSVGLHGGAAWYEDRPSGGAIFSFSLPAG
jgi:two-component system sensor histidine kinase KdpD